MSEILEALSSSRETALKPVRLWCLPGLDKGKQERSVCASLHSLFFGDTSEARDAASGVFAGATGPV